MVSILSTDKTQPPTLGDNVVLQCGVMGDPVPKVR